MIAIAISLLFGIVAFACILLIAQSTERALAAYRDISAELAAMDAAMNRTPHRPQGSAPSPTHHPRVTA